MKSSRTEWIQRYVPGSKVDSNRVNSAATIAASFPKNVLAMYMQKKENANERGIEFNLPLDEFSKLQKRSHCAYTGQPFQRDDRELKRTFERIDPTKGYLHGNVIACSAAANQAKSGLDSFEQNPVIPDEMKVHLLERALARIKQNIKNRDYEPEYTVTTMGSFMLPRIVFK